MTHTTSQAQENLYILGHPVAHSKSPAMYNALYEKMGLPWSYGFMDLPSAEEAEAFLAARDFLSINITTPYKPLAFETATAKAASAKLAQGANVLVKRGEALIGYNTDGVGCISNLERSGHSFAKKRVAVCGTGPTSLAIFHAAAVAGASVVMLLGRNMERTHTTLDGYLERFETLANATVDFPASNEGHRSFRETYEDTLFKYGTYATSKKALASADIIINATPLGMKPDDPAPFDTSLLHAGQVVFDCVYGHGVTPLVQAATDVGCSVYNGAGMLVAQAVETLFIVCEIQGVEIPYTREEPFTLMAKAAGFDL